MIGYPDAVGLPGLAALALGMLCFAIALLVARRARDPGDAATSAHASVLGIVIQGFGIALAGIGPTRVTLDPLGAKALIEASIVALLLAGAVALFAWATRTMGQNWSLRARTRADHQLVQDGPFRYCRHPIYVAMAIVLLALAVALGHGRNLILAIPIFALGTAMRVRSEEGLLRGKFGDAYDVYASRVRRFGLF